ELYLQAGMELPAGAAYEGFSIAEDGIGLVRRFEDGWARALKARRRRRPARAVTVVTGELFAPRMVRLVAPPAPAGLTVRVVPIANEWFGRGITVAGLLTGRDIVPQLAGRDLGDAVLVPAVAIRDGAGVFLDDVAPADLEAALGAPVIAVEPTPTAFM